MENIFDIFSGGFPDLKKSIACAVGYTFMFIWAIDAKITSIEGLSLTFYDWFFKVLPVSAVVSLIGFVFFAFGYYQYVKKNLWKCTIPNFSDEDKKKDWVKRVHLFNKVAIDKIAGLLMFMLSCFTYLAHIFLGRIIINTYSIQFLFSEAILAVIVFFAISLFGGLYKMIDREIYQLDTEKGIYRLV